MPGCIKEDDGLVVLVEIDVGSQSSDMVGRYKGGPGTKRWKESQRKKGEELRLPTWQDDGRQRRNTRLFPVSKGMAHGSRRVGTVRKAFYLR